MTYNIFIKKLTKIGIFLSFLFLFSGTFAATIESTSIGGNWDNSATWVGGIIPSENDIVEVYGNVTTSGKVVSGLTIHSGATLTNQNLNSTFSVTGDVNNYGTIKLLSSARKWQPYCCYITVSYNLNLKVGGVFTNFGSVTGGKLILNDTFSNSGTISTPIHTTGSGKIFIIGDIQGTINHKSEGILNLGGYVSTLNILNDTKLEGTLDIGTLNIGEYSLDINTDTIVKISRLIGAGKIQDSRNVISELTIGEIATSSGAVISFDTLQTSNLSGIFTGVAEIIMDGGSITAQEVNTQKLKLNGTISTSGFILQGDLENNGTLKNFRSNGAITIHGNIVNNGIYNGYDVKAEYNRALGWVYTYYNINLTIKGNLENNGEISNASRVYLSWSPIEDYNDYILFITGQDEINITNTTRYLISNDILNESSEIFWKVKGDGPIFDSEYSDEKCINVVNCGAIILPTPTNLTQSFIAPFTDEPQEIKPGESIGKFQSGSGVIFTAEIISDTPTDYNLLVELFRTGEIFPFSSYLTVFTSNETELIVPFLGAGNYYWKATVLDNNNNKSNPIAFGNDNFLEADFKIFEGFEPYPYGYKFNNTFIDNSLLTGGIKENSIFGFSYNREIHEGEKWDIFRNTFDLSSIENDTRKLIAAYETTGLNSSSNALNVGSCYGLSISALMSYKNNIFLSTYYNDFSNELSGTVFDSIGQPQSITDPTNSNYTLWSELSPITRAIASMQLSQQGLNALELRKENTKTPQEILDTLIQNPDESYLLLFTGKVGNRIVGHVVVPYKVEGNRIYVWDNEIPYPNFSNQLSYNQYFEINGNVTTNNFYGDWDFKSFSLINIDDIYNNNIQDAPILTGGGFFLSLFGSSDTTVVDELGRVTGYVDGEIIEEIPGSHVVIDYYSQIDEVIPEDTFKQIYFSEKRDDLEIQVTGATNESYDLMISGGDYYTKLESVETSSSQVDTYKTSLNNLDIDFDNSKVGDYTILIDDFRDTNTGSIYIANKKIIPEAQSYSIDWSNIVADTDDAIKYTVDTDNNGIFDEESIGLPSIFEDTIAPTTTVSFSGDGVPNSQIPSYYESIMINLSSEDNQDGTGLESTYYSLSSGTGVVIYQTYEETLNINGLGDYTISYYSKDNFGNIESIQTRNFTLIERPETFAGNISGFVYNDANRNGIREEGEKYMAGWKICIDTNYNDDCEENSELFTVTNNDGYYEFQSLQTGKYKILEIPHQNWIVTNPHNGYYNIDLSNGQVLTNQDFGNFKVKGGKKK